MPREIIWARVNSRKQVMAARSHALTLHSCVTLMHAHACTAMLISICPIYFITLTLTKNIDFETCTEDGKVHCKICLEHHGANFFEGWIQCGSLKSDEQSKIYENCLQWQATLNSNIAHKDLSNDEYAIAQGIAITNVDDCGAPQSHGPSSAEQEMWDDFMPTDSAFEIEQGTEEILENARKEFEHKIKGFGP